MSSNLPGAIPANKVPHDTAELLAAGLKHHQTARLAEAEACYRQVLAAQPQHPDALHLLGLIAQQARRYDLALELIRQAIRGNAHPVYFSNLGVALNDQGKLEEAIAAYRQAISIKPDFAEAYSNLGNSLNEQGKLDEAIAEYRKAINIRPDFTEAHSNLLFCLNGHDKLTNDQLFAAHREWNEQYARQAPRPAGYANECEAKRRLRIGYVSPDFRLHSVAYFVEPLLKSHDRQAVEVFCYAEVMQPDTVTAHLQGLADHWLVTVGLSDDELADRIRMDGIDILVDLAGHTAKNRLLVFARKPAPVQVTWLGYPNTTGLEAIDYRLVDAVTDPVADANAFASEILVRLEGGFLCYAGLKNELEPGAPPCLQTGTVTFGSFRQPGAKVGPATLDAWATLLARLPKARLLLKGKSFADAPTRAFFLARLTERGVAAGRVELMAPLPDATAHQALYNLVDVALDPFPNNGTTTTCEALWMGVPVVTLRGDRHAGRVGASLLTQIDLTDLIADSVDEYVEIALGLAASPGRLAQMRRSLRAHLAASTLCDGTAFARKVETAFRKMWYRWCETERMPAR
jgi:predicted O-linked N-acetylglucosamine transferase (SPINDLY family)